MRLDAGAAPAPGVGKRVQRLGEVLAEPVANEPEQSRHRRIFDAVIGAIPFSPPRENALAAQHNEMSRHAGLLEARRFDQIAHATLPLHQGVEDPKSRRIAERTKTRRKQFESLGGQDGMSDAFPCHRHCTVFTFYLDINTLICTYLARCVTLSVPTQEPWRPCAQEAA